MSLKEGKEDWCLGFSSYMERLTEISVVVTDDGSGGKRNLCINTSSENSHQLFCLCSWM